MSSTRVLVVEDENIVAMDIKNRLEELGYIVPAVVASGEESIEKVVETLPDLVLMDIVLKGQMDGVEAAKKISERFDIPVLYLTAYSDEITILRAKLTEPFAYIIKPFEDKELHTAIEIALYKHKMESKLKKSEKWFSTTLESIGDAVIATDKEGYIKFINPTAKEVIGWNENDMVGKPLKDVFKIFNEETGALIEDPLVKVIYKGSKTISHNNLALLTKQGTIKPIDYIISPITDEKGNIIGIVLVFRDITQEKHAKKEKEQLIKEKTKSELLGFLLSAIPVFASNVPPQIRDTMAKIFADRFEKNMKPQFQIYMINCLGTTVKNEKNKNKILNCYSSWLSKFLSNIGIETETKSVRNMHYLKFLNCPWVEDAKSSPMFCVMCRVIVLRSFTWNYIKGNVQQTSCIADGSGTCMFKFILSEYK